MVAIKVQLLDWSCLGLSAAEAKYTRRVQFAFHSKYPVLNYGDLLCKARLSGDWAAHVEV